MRTGRIVRLDPAGAHHARRAGFGLEHGDTADRRRSRPCRRRHGGHAGCRARARPMPPEIARLYLTDPIADFGPLDGIMFSGGVGEYVYGREHRDFGDMGRRLGHAIRRRIEPAHCPGRCCRRANASARLRSAHRNIRSSSPATPATFRRRACCCRGAISRCCSRTTFRPRRSIPTRWRTRSAATS